MNLELCALEVCKSLHRLYENCICIYIYIYIYIYFNATCHCRFCRSSYIRLPPQPSASSSGGVSTLVAHCVQLQRHVGVSYRVPCASARCPVSARPPVVCVRPRRIRGLPSVRSETPSSINTPVCISTQPSTGAVGRERYSTQTQTSVMRRTKYAAAAFSIPPFLFPDETDEGSAFREEEIAERTGEREDLWRNRRESKSPSPVPPGRKQLWR